LGNFPGVVANEKRGSAPAEAMQQSSSAAARASGPAAVRYTVRKEKWTVFMVVAPG